MLNKPVKVTMVTMVHCSLKVDDLPSFFPLTFVSFLEFVMYCLADFI